MKKKSIAVLFAALIVFCAVFAYYKTADKNKNGVSETETSFVPVSQTEETTAVTRETGDTVITSSEITEPTEKTAVTVQTYSFKENGGYVYIPEFSVDGYSEISRTVNEQIMRKYRNFVNRLGDGDEYNITKTQIKTSDEQFVSVLMYGRFISQSQDSVTGASDFAYTVNFSPKNNRIYRTEELIRSAEDLKKAFADGKFTQTDGISGVLEEITLSDMTVAWRDDYSVLPDVYFTDDGKVGVVVELPAAIGGYAVFEASAKDIPITDAAKQFAD